jgi:acyl-CoA hydrolase
MDYIKLTAAEGAAMISDGATIAFSGFTPNGVAKAVARELSKRAVTLHEQGRPFAIGMITGA